MFKKISIVLAFVLTVQILAPISVIARGFTEESAYALSVGNNLGRQPFVVDNTYELCSLQNWVIADQSQFPIIQSEITLPYRRLTPSERAVWIAEYWERGGVVAYEEEVLRLVNEVRLAHGREPVQQDRTLSMAARFHAQIMATFGVDGNWSHHVGPYAVDGERASWHLANAFGARSPWNGNASGSSGNRSPGSVVQGLLNSPGHCRSLLNPNNRYAGSGVHRGSHLGINGTSHYLMLTATPSLPRRTATIVGGEISTVLGSTAVGEFLANEIAEINAIVPTGYRFVHWEGSVNFEDATSINTTFVMPASNVTVTAVFEQLPSLPTIAEPTEPTMTIPLTTVPEQTRPMVTTVPELTRPTVTTAPEPTEPTITVPVITEPTEPPTTTPETTAPPGRPPVTTAPEPTEPLTTAPVITDPIEPPTTAPGRPPVTTAPEPTEPLTTAPVITDPIEPPTTAPGRPPVTTAPEPTEPLTTVPVTTDPIEPPTTAPGRPPVTTAPEPTEPSTTIPVTTDPIEPPTTAPGRPPVTTAPEPTEPTTTVPVTTEPIEPPTTAPGRPPVTTAPEPTEPPTTEPPTEPTEPPPPTCSIENPRLGIIISSADTALHYGPGSATPRLEDLPLSTPIKVGALAHNNNWVQACFNDVQGYVSRGRVDIIDIFDESRSGFVSTPAGLHAGPGSVHRAINANVEPGTPIEILGIAQNGNWYYVNVDGVVGFISRGRTIQVGPTTMLPTSQRAIIGTVADFNQGPGSIHRSVTGERLPVGTEILILGIAQNGNWAYVQVGDHTGYVSRGRIDHVTFTPERTITLSSTTAELRAGAGSIHDFVIPGPLPQRTEVTILGVSQNGNWYYVRVGEHYGFISRGRVW